MLWNRNEKQEWLTSGLDFPFFTSRFPSFYFPFSSSQLTISAISSRNITHFTAQYGWRCSVIWLILVFNMMHVGTHSPCVRSLNHVYIPFNIDGTDARAVRPYMFIHGILCRKMIEITAQNDWFQLAKSIQSVCKTASFASQIALFYLIIWFLMVYKSVKYGFYSYHLCFHFKYASYAKAFVKENHKIKIMVPYTHFWIPPHPILMGK